MGGSARGVCGRGVHEAHKVPFIHIGVMFISLLAMSG